MPAKWICRCLKYAVRRTATMSPFNTRVPVGYCSPLKIYTFPTILTMLNGVCPIVPQSSENVEPMRNQCLKLEKHAQEFMDYLQESVIFTSKLFRDNVARQLELLKNKDLTPEENAELKSLSENYEKLQKELETYKCLTKYIINMFTGLGVFVISYVNNEYFDKIVNHMYAFEYAVKVEFLMNDELEAKLHSDKKVQGMANASDQTELTHLKFLIPY